MAQGEWPGARTAALIGTRSAEALLRTIGATSVVFRFPVPAIASGDGVQLGSVPPPMQEISIAPVLVRKPTSTDTSAIGFELVIAASTLRQLAEQQGAAELRTLLAQIAAIEWNGRTYHIKKVASELFGGSEYLYRIQVAE